MSSVRHLPASAPVLLLLLGCAATGGERAVSADPALDPEVPYLESLRRAAEEANLGAAQQWRRDQQDYADEKLRRLGELRDHPFLAFRPEWTDDQRIGWDTWFHWTGGNELMWRDLAQRSGAKLNLLRLLDNRLVDRGERFARFGLINDPGASPPQRDTDGRCVVDRFGLCLDRVAEPATSTETESWIGRASGIMGLRLFDNPDYRPEAWRSDDPWSLPAGCRPGQRGDSDPSAVAAASAADCYQPPYLVGMTCGFCHISFNPESPPEDPAAPEWRHLVAALGNVYLKEGPLFSWFLDFGEDHFYTAYLEAQPPGTSDTSRIATDDLDNPSAINAIFQLGARLAEAEVETQPNGAAAPVPHVLKDGADSVGVPLASLRVYVNLGLVGNYWLGRHDAYLLLGGVPRPQEPFRVAEAMVTPAYDGKFAWNRTEARIADVAAFLGAMRPFKLDRAPGGKERLSAAEEQDRGKRVFADGCAGCHSSKQPEVDRRREPERWRREMRSLVLADDFLEDNLLADDRRYPADVVGVNLSRSMATNALEGHIWQDFSSLSYKRLPAIDRQELPDPFRGGEGLSFRPPGGGRGYYRTASLVSLWATAPFFHNNSVGRHVHDPGVEGRLEAFEDAAEQLLWPERRTDPDGRPGPYVKRTGDRVTWLELPGGLLVPLPPRYPIKALGNLPLHSLVEKLPGRLREQLAGDGSLSSRERKARIVREVLGNDHLRKLLRRVLLDWNAAPDFVENRGHEAIVARIDADDDKRALIEFLKTL